MAIIIKSWLFIFKQIRGKKKHGNIFIEFGRSSKYKTCYVHAIETVMHVHSLTCELTDMWIHLKHIIKLWSWESCLKASSSQLHTEETA